MSSSQRIVRRGMFAAFAACAAGGASVAVLTGVTSPAATAAADPCAASAVAKTIGVVATSMGNYLDTHPQTNQALTTISQQQAGPQSLAALKMYFDANPQAARDIQTLQSPLTDLGGRCGLPINISQVFGMLQNVQQGTLPAQLSTPMATVQGTGPLPGPSTVSPR
jgi:heme-binding protein